jgi:hypothetical protein
MRRAPLRHAALLALSLAIACGGGGGEPTRPEPGETRQLVVALEGLPSLDAATEGAWELWAVDGAGAARSLGRFATGTGSHVVPWSGAAPASVLVTLERPGDTDALPSSQVVLRGAMQGGRAALGVAGALTVSQPLREQPGQFTMFSPSDNAMHGYPSHEEAGVWLFNMAPRSTSQNDMWVRLAPLAPGWTYEGWMVRDVGSAGAVWLSYGKFLPDAFGAVNSRDDTGWGPFSGRGGVSRRRLDLEPARPRRAGRDRPSHRPA